ncbi:MAG: acetoacetate decarboxylase family protein, partial [Chloroflexota bacterium]
LRSGRDGCCFGPLQRHKLLSGGGQITGHSVTKRKQNASHFVDLAEGYQVSENGCTQENYCLSIAPVKRSFATGKAAVPLAPGSRFGATCSANDRQIARAVVTLRQISETGPTVNDPPMYNTRHFPAYSGLIPDVFELVKAQSYDRSATEIWEGDAELKFYDDTLEDLQAIAPHEVMKGYRFSFGYSVDGGSVIAQHDKSQH